MTLNRNKASQRIAELRREIEKHNRLYYVEARPEISDRDYDRLYEELQDLEQLFPGLASPDSPTRRVGGEPLKEFRHVKHEVPMLSLEKAMAFEEAKEDGKTRKVDLRQFDNRLRKELGDKALEYVLEPKVDGVSITAVYENGKLALAATRGDGEVGDDVTLNFKTIRNVPLALAAAKPPSLIEVRGEVYMDRDGFRKLNDEMRKAGEEPFPNTRNATAGSLKQLDPGIVARRPLRVVFYGIGRAKGISFAKHSEALRGLKDLGLPTSKFWWLCRGIEETAERTEELYARESELPFDIDGAVIKLDDMGLWERLGRTATHPSYAIAYKPRNRANRAATGLLGITWQVGRTGVVTPVAELQTVFLDGTNISRATLHNCDFIRKKDIREGDTVVIERAGKVIPAVVGVAEGARRGGKGKSFAAPDACPECGGPLVKKMVASGTKEEAAIRCDNLQCPAQITRRIEHFAQRSALDIEGLGGVVAETLVERNLAKSPLDLFNPDLQKKLGTLNLGTDDEPRQLGEKNAAKIISAIERSRSLPLSRWLFALAIPNMGETIAYHVASMHKDIASVVSSPILRAIVELARKNEEALLINPKSRRNPPRDDAEACQRQSRHATILKEIEKLEAALPKDLSSEVGPVVARSILDFIASSKGKQILARLKDLGISPAGQAASAGSGAAAGSAGNFAGKTVVLTGTLDSMDRDKATREIRSRGGNVSSSVSGKTDFVVAGKEPGGNKISDAAKHGVTVIDEAGFLAMLGSSGKPAPAKTRDEPDLFSLAKAPNHPRRNG